MYDFSGLDSLMKNMNNIDRLINKSVSMDSINNIANIYDKISRIAYPNYNIPINNKLVMDIYKMPKYIQNYQLVFDAMNKSIDVDKYTNLINQSFSPRFFDTLYKFNNNIVQYKLYKKVMLMILIN